MSRLLKTLFVLAACAGSSAYAQTPASLTLSQATEVVGARPLTEQEVNKIKDSNVRGLPGSFETTSQVLSAMDEIVQYARPDDYVQTLKARTEAVTQPDAQAAIKEIVQPGALTWVIVGDLKKIEQPVRALKLGEVQVIDGDGKPVK